MGLHFCLLLSHIFYYLSKGKIHIILVKPTSYPTDIKENWAYPLNEGFPLRLLAGAGRLWSCSSRRWSAPTHVAQRKEQEVEVLSTPVFMRASNSSLANGWALLSVSWTVLDANSSRRSNQSDVVMFRRIRMSRGQVLYTSFHSGRPSMGRMVEMLAVRLICSLPSKAMRMWSSIRPLGLTWAITSAPKLPGFRGMAFSNSAPGNMSQLGGGNSILCAGKML